MSKARFQFNEKELIKVGESSSTIEGILQYLKPQASEWSDWYQSSVYKERIFKLVNNLLFYYRISELHEPLGILVLENCQVAYENKGPPFAFSLTFVDGKHIFGCRCQEDVNRWVGALKMASYDHWRSLYVILQTKIGMRHGKNPVLNYIQKKQSSAETIKKYENMTVTRTKNSSFYTHLNDTNVEIITKTNVIPVENLIDLT